MITWTDLGEGLSAWVVDGRPVLVRDSDPDGFRHDLACERVEGLLGWRVELEWLGRRGRGTKAVVRLCRRYEMDYRAFQAVPTRMLHDSYSRREKLSSLCQLAGLPAYSGEYELTAPYEGHPAGSYAIHTMGRGGCLAVIEEPGLGGAVAALLTLLEGRAGGAAR